SCFDPSHTTPSSSFDPSQTTTSSSFDPTQTTTSSSFDPTQTTTSSSFDPTQTTTSSSDNDLTQTTTSSSNNDPTQTTTSSSDNDPTQTTTSSSDNDPTQTTTSSNADIDGSGTTTSSDGGDNPQETTTTAASDFVKDIRFDVDGDVDGNRNFYFSHDPRPFQVDDLVRSATVKEVVELDGKEYETDVPVDKSKIAFGLDSSAPDANLNPAAIVKKMEAAGQEFTYTLTPLYIFYDGYVAETQVYIYIGVKGDTNLNGIANAMDSGKILVYAAEFGSGQKTYLTSEDGDTVNQAVEALAWFLSDVNTESRDLGETSNADGDEPVTINAKDAAYILTYAAVFGSGKGDKTDWVTDVLNPNDDSSFVLPKFTKEIFDWKAQNS
ncbi:MAG: hypothetical protein K2H89_10930, partial [Oscillospiraceae bacterium]|nr:hypothetical protein [Oscillospiraceae bacterium]